VLDCSQKALNDINQKVCSGRTGKITVMSPRSSRSSVMFDLDNDGDLDIVVMNGHIYPQIDRHPEFVGTYEQQNLLAENGGAGATPMFRDVTNEAGPGFAARASSRGLAVGDFDNDGDLDLLVTHLDRPPSLLRNDSTGGSWLTVIPIDRHGVRSPIGTLVTITAGGRRQFRDIAAGDSYMSTHDPRPHFGVGDAAIVDQVDVRWPDGSHSVRSQVRPRQFLTITQ
jgi:hypothetical protein